jgi:hypothetical protein
MNPEPVGARKELHMRGDPKGAVLMVGDPKGAPKGTMCVGGTRKGLSSYGGRPERGAALHYMSWTSLMHTYSWLVWWVSGRETTPAHTHAMVCGGLVG